MRKKTEFLVRLLVDIQRWIRDLAHRRALSERMRGLDPFVMGHHLMWRFSDLFGLMAFSVSTSEWRTIPAHVASRLSGSYVVYCRVMG